MCVFDESGQKSCRIVYFPTCLVLVILLGILEVTCMSTESDSDSKLLRNTLIRCQTFQNNTEERNLFPITIISSKSTL